jgi:E3 ubiquitin-protein ligase DOA10
MPIGCLGGISGPIKKPVIMDPTDVLELVKRGFLIYEHNPFFTKEKVQVTRTNYNKITFKITRVAAIKKKRLNREIQRDSKEEIKNTIKNEKKNNKNDTGKENFDNTVKTSSNDKKDEVKPVVTDFIKS